MNDGRARVNRVFVDPSLICQECHAIVADDRRHTYLDCLRWKWEHAGLTRQEMESLFEYARLGEEDAQ